MFDTFWDNVKTMLKSRLFPIVVIYTLLFSILVHRIFVLQVVQSEFYEKKSENESTATRKLKSTRGCIYDCNGIRLASNDLSFTVTFEDSGKITENADLNAMFLKLINLIEKNGGTIATEFSIGLDKKGKFYFTEDERHILNFKRDAYFCKSKKELTKEQLDADAEAVFNYLRTDSNPKFLIDPTYSKEDALKIMAIRYSIMINSISKNPTVIATEINDATVAAIKENSTEFPGVEIQQETKRSYKDSKYFANILGYTGLIPSESLESDAYKNYSSTDQIGKNGLEKTMEKYLHGTNGSETVVVNGANRITKVNKRVDPVAGDDLYLTIDSDLQKACYHFLEKKIASIVCSNIVNSKSVGTKGRDEKYIKIPIYDVYSGLIENNVINIDALNKSDSTNLERSVYKKFTDRQKVVLQELRQLMGVNSTTRGKDTSDQNEEYLDYVYDAISAQDLIIKNKAYLNDSQHKAYASDKISLSKFLQHAIENNWVNLGKLDIGKKFYSTDEIYLKLLDYTINLLKEDSKFSKIVYKDMIYSYLLSGKEVCLLLYEQGVLKSDQTAIQKLQQNAVSPYSFIMKKIQDLEITPGQLGLDPCSGSVVVTKVKTGDVLTLVSYPGFDNNKLANSMDIDYYYSLETKASPMYSKALQARSAPGSTFKMLTSVAALEEGVVRAGETVRDLVKFPHAGGPECASKTGHGNVDVPNALEVSCNYFFFEMGWRLGNNNYTTSYNTDRGISKIRKYAKMFGLNRKSGVELEEIDCKNNISTQDAVRSAIGQGSNNYSPAQLSRYVTALANRGTTYKLTLIDKIKDVKGKVIKDNKAKVINKVKIKDSTWNLVQQGMNLVVNGPQSHVHSSFTNVNVAVAGKTGTAQETKSRPNHALFVSFAPYQNPEIAVTVVIRNGYASANAAAVAGQIYQYYFDKNSREALLNQGVSNNDTASQGIID